MLAMQTEELELPTAAAVTGVELPEAGWTVLVEVV